MNLDKAIEKVLVSKDEIQKISKELGKKITKDYQNSKDLILLGLLKGCIPFMGDLMRYIDLPVELEFMNVSSYKGGISSSGDIKILMDINTSVAGRDILICEDIVDTGKTLNTVVKLLLHRGAKSVEVVTLLDKPEGRVIPFTPKYIGVTIPKYFVVGYGLDFSELYRNLPYVGVLKEHYYMKDEE